MYGNHNRIGYVKELSEKIHRLNSELDGYDWETDPYFFQDTREDGSPNGCRHAPQTREEYKEYLTKVLTPDFIEKILDDNFLNEDDPAYIKKQDMQKYLNKGFDEELSQLLVDIDDGDITLEDGDDEFLEALETKDQYVIILDDSDGDRRRFEATTSKEVLKHICKTRHRKTIGCNCREYVNAIYLNGKNTGLEADDLKI